MPQKLKLISQGAEAKIFLDKNKNIILKDRVKKSYRIPELDEKIRKQRTKSEMKLLIKANNIINTPQVLDSENVNSKYLFKLQYINGKKLSEHLNTLQLPKQKQILRQIGQDTAKLHDINIIHGDLTTSNMILVKKNPASQINKTLINNETINIINKSDSSLLTISHQSTNKVSSNLKVYFIDFGLGFISNRIEDKAVDIHLLKQALEARHFKNWEVLFSEFIKGYKNSKDSKKILQQLDSVEKRRRYKH
ncbi:MAG: hypothetical protein AABW81_03000 [Nanoarchaeota archaeon]